MKKYKTTEEALIDRALAELERETGLVMHQKESKATIKQPCADALITLKNTRFYVEVKRRLVAANLGAVINQIKNFPGPGLLITDYVNPNMARELKQADVPFIDIAGNAYINQNDCFVYIKGNKQKLFDLPLNEPTGRAFATTGLKVVYAFLCDPERVNWPYREIAEHADVALGTVGWVINDLKEAGYILDKGGRNGRKLQRYKELLDRWVTVYPEKLKRKLYLGEFAAQDEDWWKKAVINDCEAYWGGETAAAKYTDYLRPQEATVYVPEQNHGKLIMHNRLRKQTGGAVKMYKTFWKTEADKDLAHPVLVYADLLATRDARNREVAGKIYEQELAQYCE